MPTMTKMKQRAGRSLRARQTAFNRSVKKKYQVEYDDLKFYADPKGTKKSLEQALKEVRQGKLLKSLW